jgi:hypothetical protein
LMSNKRGVFLLLMGNIILILIMGVQNRLKNT